MRSKDLHDVSLSTPTGLPVSAGGETASRIETIEQIIWRRYDVLALELYDLKNCLLRGVALSVGMRPSGGCVCLL
jgi:hypothetical protein